MKKFISFILTVVLTLSICTYAFAYEGECSAKAAILYQPDTGAVLFEKDSESAYLIASTTKIMTALVVLENTSADEIVEIRSEYTSIEGSSMYLKPGERFTVKELLYGMMLVSGNDAATALACHVSGSIEDFAVLMNEKANELGCVNSNFVNPHGLDGDEHYSCAHDLALIMAEAMENDIFAEVTGTKNISLGGRTFTNHNKLLWSCDGVIGGKTGYTQAAGRVLVSFCSREDMDLICVTISDGDDWNDHSSMYDWAYEEYCITEYTGKFTIPVISGVSENVTAASEEFMVLGKKDEPVQTVYNIPEFLYAPVERGEIVGTVKVITENGSVEFDVTAMEDVALDETVPLGFWEQLKWSWYYFNEHSGYVPFLPRY